MKKERMITFAPVADKVCYTLITIILLKRSLVLDLCTLWYNNTINLIASCGFYGDVNKSLNV